MNNEQRLALTCNYRLTDVSTEDWVRDSDTMYRVPVRGLYDDVELVWVLIPAEDVLVTFHDPLHLENVSYDMVFTQSSYSCLGVRKDGSEEIIAVSRERLLLLWSDREPVYEALYFLPVSSIQKEGSFWIVSWVSSFLHPDASLFVSVPESDVLWQVDTETLDYRVFFGHVMFSNREIAVAYKNKETGWHLVRETVSSEMLAKDYAYSCRANILQVTKKEYMDALNQLLEER